MAAGNEIIFKSTRLPSLSFSRFQDMRQKSQLCDITFIIGDQTVSAHRIVLAAGIPYFADMLFNKDEESDKNEFNMPSINSGAWKTLIDYAYNGEVKINSDNVLDLLSAACVLNVEEVKDTCSKFLEKQLCCENATTIQEFASVHDCLELAEKAGSYIRKHFEEVSAMHGFLEMPFRSLSRLISSDSIKVTSEEKIFEAVMRWVKKHPGDRKHHLPNILRQVRLPLLESQYLCRKISSEELIHESSICRNLLDDARNYNFLPRTEKVLCGFNSRPRDFKESEKDVMDNQDTIYFVSNQLSVTVNRFNPISKDWQVEKNGLYELDGGNMVWLASRKTMYYFYATNVLSCTVPEGEWKSCSRRYLRHFAASATLGNEIYICGGINCDSECNYVECFDTETTEWRIVKSMNVKRIYSSAVSLQGCIYVTGGMNGCAALNSVEKYSPLVNRWVVMPPMLTERWGHSCSSLNGKVYACSGISPEASQEKCVISVEVYDTITLQWTFINSMHIPRRFFQMISYCGKLYAFGGKDDQDNYVNTLEVYVPERDRWEFGTPTCPDGSISGVSVLSFPIS